MNSGVNTSPDTVRHGFRRCFPISLVVVTLDSPVLLNYSITLSIPVASSVQPPSIRMFASGKNLLSFAMKLLSSLLTTKPLLAADAVCIVGTATALNASCFVHRSLCHYFSDAVHSGALLPSVFIDAKSP